ncbi:XerC Integrase [Candidatus Nanopelagicaceae bacterium]
MSRRSNGQGHTYKVKNSYRTVIHYNGHVVTAMAATTQESRKLAKEKLEKLPKIVGTKNSLPQSKIALAEYLISWLDDAHKHQIAHSTWKRYRALAVHHIIPVIGKIPLRKIVPSDIQSVLTVMREVGQSPRSQQQARALLSVALGEAENNEYIPSNPVKKVRIPVNKNREIEPLTIEEVKRLLETYKATFMSARLHIALLCGLRQGEALGLRWQDVDLVNGVLEVRNQIQMIDGKLQLTGLKTERSRRSLVLTSGSLLALKVHKELVENMKLIWGSQWVDTGLVFPAIDGTPKQATVDYKEWKRALRLCGIKPRRLHDARHTAATLMYGQGVGIEVISRSLGHSSSAITSKLYVHSAIQPLRLAAEKMEKLMIDMG